MLAVLAGLVGAGRRWAPPLSPRFLSPRSPGGTAGILGSISETPGKDRFQNLLNLWIFEGFLCGIPWLILWWIPVKDLLEDPCLESWGFWRRFLEHPSICGRGDSLKDAFEGFLARSLEMTVMGSLPN